MNVIAPLLCAFLPGLPDDVINCGWELPTVRQMMDEGHIVVVAKYVSTEKPIPRQTIGRTTFQVIEIIRDTEETLAGKEEFVVERYLRGQPGELYLLYGSPIYSDYWWQPLSISRTSLKYIKEIAAFDVLEPKWREFYLDYLEHPDPFIARDAYTECEGFSLPDIKAMSSKLPRDKLRKWIKSDKIGCRQGLYSLMLGLCGDDKDAELLAGFIKKPVNENCEDTEGVMCGYLLLQGQKGLALLDSRIQASAKKSSTDAYVAMRALRFAWLNTDIPKDRLKKSMRLLLDHPTAADLAIWQLTFWKDWDAQEQVMAVYENKKINAPHVKQSVARYFVACSKDTAINDDGNPVQEHAITATNHLFTLRQKDRRMVEQVERSYHLSN